MSLRDFWYIACPSRSLQKHPLGVTLFGGAMVLWRDATGHLAPILIGAGSQIGSYTLLTAGTMVDPGESLKAFPLSPPFTHWSGGRRARPALPR